MGLNEFIAKVRQNPALEQVWKNAAKAALQCCAETDEALLGRKPIPSWEKFDTAWQKLKEEAKKYQIVFEEKVEPHDVTQIIAK